MARYVLLYIEDDAEADRLLLDMANWSDGEILTPVQENRVNAQMVDRAFLVSGEVPTLREVVNEQHSRTARLVALYEAEG